MKERALGIGVSAMGTRLGVVLALIVVASVAVCAQFVVVAFERALAPELANRSQLLGTTIREALQRPLDRGVPFEALGGLDQYISEAIDKFEEVERIAITTTSGKTLAEVARPVDASLLRAYGVPGLTAEAPPPFSFPILSGNNLVGTISVTVRSDFVRARLYDAFLDLAVLAIVAIVIALELVLAVVLWTIQRPLDGIVRLLVEQRDGRFVHQVPPSGLGSLGRMARRLNDRASDLAQRIHGLGAATRSQLSSAIAARIAVGHPLPLLVRDPMDVRPALFLLSVSTEIATAFLPIYAKTATRPDWLSPEMAAASPLLAYLVAISAVLPFSARFVRRHGARRLAWAAMLPIALALAAMAIASDVVQIAILRGLIGAFYALAIVACQEYALEASSADGRTGQAVGGYLAVIYGGVFAGSALGGVLAARLGFTVTFLLAAGLAMLGAALAAAILQRPADAIRAPLAGPPDNSGLLRIPMSGRYLALLFGIAMPMNAATAMFVWYVTPLSLSAASFGTADIARIVMLYYLAAIVMGPVVARWMRHGERSALALLVGALASGFALWHFDTPGDYWATLWTMVALGIGHTAMRAPLHLLAGRISADLGSGTTALRMAERIGAIAGLMIAVFSLGAETGASIPILGAVVLTGGAVFAITEAWQRLRAPRLET